MQKSIKVAEERVLTLILKRKPKKTYPTMSIEIK